MTFLFFSVFSIQAQTYCEDIPGRSCDDCPTIPVSENPDLLVNCEDEIDIILIIDESNSIDSQTLENNVRDGVLAFLGELECKPVKVAIIEFGSVANYVVPTYREVGSALTTDITNYFNDNVGFNGNTYTPDNFSNNNLGGTNWQAALLRANALPTADMLLMFTDGKPTAYSPDATSPGSSYNFCDSGSDTEEAEIYNAAVVANLLKAKNTHMFVLGIGNTTSTYIPSITGTNEYNASDGDLISNSDYEIDPNFANLAACFRNIANNLCSIIVESEGSTVCQGETNGVIDITLTTLATGPFTVTVTNGPTNVSPFSTSQVEFSVSDLAAGTYKVKVESNDGCYEEGSVFVTIGVSAPGATCNNLADVPLETCTAAIPTNYDAGDTDGELADVFSDVLTCGTAGIRHEDSNPGDICNGTTITRTYYLTDDGVDVPGVVCSRDFVFTAPELTLVGSCPTDPNLDGCSSELETSNALSAWLSDLQTNFSADGGCNAMVEFSPALDQVIFPTPCNPLEQVITVSIFASDDCGETTEVECSFTQKAYSNDLELSAKPTDITTDACEDPSSKFDSWIAALEAMTASGGCEAEVEYSVDLATLSVDGYCNTTAQVVSVDINAKDTCSETVPVTATFTVPAYSNDLELSAKPADVITSACVNPADEFAAWIAALEAMTASGGCNAEVEYSVDLATLFVSGYCNTTAQVVSVDVNAKDDCGETTPVTATFTVPAYTNDLALVGECPTENGVDGCSTNEEISVAFDIWKAAVLANFSATGGCNAEVEYSTDVLALQAPTQCGSTDQVISVDINAKDDCGETSVTTCSFTVKAFGSTLEITEVADESYDSCDYANQGEVEAVFQTFLDKFGYTGGCDASGQLASAYSAPDLCAGGTVNVTYNVTDLCESDNETASFTITPSEALEVSCATAVNLSSSSTQQEIQDAYDAWKLEFTKTGGCNATDNLDTFPSLPSFDCGTGVDLSFTYTAIDRCNPNGVSCSSTFIVPGIIGLTVTCPDTVILPACSSEADILEAFNTWKAGFSVNGGDSPTSNIDLIENFDPTQLYNCNGSGSLGFDFSAYDACNPNGVTCFSEFGIDSNEQLELSAKPADVTTSACVNPADEFAAWILALQNMTASGGCDAEVEYSVDLSTLSVDGYCNTSAQVVSVDIIAKDDCGETTPVTATFTVPAYTNDLALVGECPTANGVDGCSTNVEISAAFDIWKAAVLANFSATGGCNAEVEYSTDVATLQAPTQCGSTDQVISVGVSAKDDCGETSVTTCSFTVKAFGSTLEITEVADETYASCDYETQTELDAAFQTFLDKFGYTGGCDALGQLASAYSAPDLCSGGTVNVTYNVTDLCESDNEIASFTITSSAALEVSCPSAVSLDSSSTQQEIQDAYDAWKLEFTKTGGCNATDNLDTFPSLPDFNCGTGIDLSFTYTATDRCHPNGVSCSSTFFVPGIVGLTVTCPDPVNLPACSSEADILEAFNTWKAGFIVNGGDNPTSNIALLEALDPTQLLNCSGGAFLRFNFNAYDACNPNGVTCGSEFSTDSKEQLELSTKPADVTTSACVNPVDEFATWILALENMTASGGCNAEVEYSVDLATLSVSGYCNTTAQVVSVDVNAKDDCGETTPVTATFTVPAYSDDLQLVGSCPTDNEVDGCSTNAEISAAFDIWKAAVLANFGATGGCNAEVEYSTDVLALQAPTQCGSTDQVISVDINAKDDCGETSVTTCSFTVKAFGSTLEITEVADETYASCDYETQTELDAAFQTFLDKFGYTGGCDALGQLASAYNAPDLCSGGTVNVTYNVTDLCESDNETASFTITPSEALEVSCPIAVSLGSSLTQQEIEDAYDAWKLDFTKIGGCNATDNFDDFPSLPSYGCDTSIELSFEYIATDRCHPNGVSCSSTFSIEGRESVDAGENGELTICENGTVTAQELFEALGGDPDEGGTWAPELGGANIYTYTVQGIDPCSDATATVTVDELNLEISASEPLCDEEFGIYTVNIQVSEGIVSSTLGTPVDNGGGSWTIMNIPTDNNIVVTTTSLVSNGVECANSVDVISPDCICIELEVSYTDVTCFGLDDGTITVDFVTEDATVTVNGELYDSEAYYGPGTYTVTAYFEGNNDENCVISEVISIEEPALVNIEVSTTDVTCYGAEDGTITIDSLSEGASYTIKLNGLGPDLSGQEYFAPGTYFIEASLSDNSLSRKSSGVKKGKLSRVQNPCVDAKLVVIGQPNELFCKIGKSYDGNEIRCADRTNNSLTVDQIGGVGPYTYSWSMNKSAYYGMWKIVDGAEDQTMTYMPGLQSATFFVEVTDANGCSTTCEITLNSTCTKEDYYNYFTRQAEFDYEMFPNPTKGMLTIKPNSLDGNSATVEIFDLIGTRVLNKIFDTMNDKGINVNLSNLASQVYYLKVTTKNGTKIKKVVLDK